MKVRIYLALMVMAILVPVIVFSAAALNMLLRAEREAALRGARETARATAVAVDRELDNARTALRLLGTSRYLAQDDWEGFYGQASVAQADKGTWVTLLEPDGRQVINTDLPFGTPLAPVTYPALLRQQMKAEKPVVSDLLTDPVDGQHLVGVSMPAPLEGEKRYVLSQMFRADYFNRTFAQPGIAPSWIIGIFDRDGRTVTRNHRAVEYVGKPVRPEILEAARTAREGYVRNRTRDGIEIYTAYTHSTMSGWGVAVGVPVEEIEWAARRAVIVAGLGLLAALACAGAMGIFFARRLSRSIAGAVQSATALGKGEAPPVARSSVAEVDKLHAALAEAGIVLLHERESRALVEQERARLLTSEQEARQFLEVQNKAKDEFLAMLGHELRNPLNAITSAISVMEVEGIGADKVERARTILRRQSLHLGRIVDDLLDLSRVMSGKIFLARERTDLAEVVRESVATLAATGVAEQHVVNLHTENAWVDADPTRLEQIISNLLVNAFKYTPAGGRVDIDVRPVADEAILTVRDSGIGVSAELLSNVFDVFVQGPAQLDRSKGGLGIGLSLVRRLVSLHGGTVSGQSAGTGQGSTFTVRLPLLATPVDAQHTTRGAAIPVQNTCRVLLIEDNEDSRQTLSSILVLRGYHVHEAADGTAGVRIALAEQPDVAVVDIGLPGIDGYEVARQLRGADGARRIGLIALTGYGQAEDKERALSAGFDLHLTKPVEAQRLIEAIAKVQRAA
jgi:signal transduction histidine kinase/ActR/RegA family two-component response regulator